MLKSVIAASFVGMAASAQAADLPVREPVVKTPVAAVYDWSGFYFGVNAGAGTARDLTRLSVPSFPSFEQSYLDPQGALGGAQIGYNWQVPSAFFGPIVFGVEADFQGTTMRDNYTCLLTCNSPGVLGGAASQFDQKLDWFGTFRGRVGLASGPVLSYITAGWAYGNVKSTLTETLGTVQSFSTNQNRGGWTYGSGVEASLGGDWTAKIEYLWFTLGDRQDTFALNTLPQTMSSQIREQLFRAGVNYRINGNNAAYMLPPASNWAGFYLGGNIGSGTARNRTTLNVGGPSNPSEFFNLSPDGINGGVQAGYNWQVVNWVFGVEADLQGADQTDNKACVFTCNVPARFVSYNAQLPWFATARGRIGYVVGPTLFYATAGFAVGDVKIKVSDSFVAPFATSFSTTRTGWTGGGGFETPFELGNLFGPSWTTKTEYLYVDLGTQTDNIAGPPAITTSTKIHEHMLRTSLSYHFNSPVVAKY